MFCDVTSGFKHESLLTLTTISADISLDLLEAAGGAFRQKEMLFLQKLNHILTDFVCDAKESSMCLHNNYTLTATEKRLTLNRLFDSVKTDSFCRNKTTYRYNNQVMAKHLCNTSIKINISTTLMID